MAYRYTKQHKRTSEGLRLYSKSYLPKKIRAELKEFARAQGTARVEAFKQFTKEQQIPKQEVSLYLQAIKKSNLLAQEANQQFQAEEISVYAGQATRKMKEIEDLRTSPFKVGFSDIKSKGDFSEILKKQITKTKPSYIKKRQYQYKRNYIESVRKVYGNTREGQIIVNKLERMNLKSFMDFSAEKESKISYIYLGANKEKETSLKQAVNKHTK